jgi:hypothetical protein
VPTIHQRCTVDAQQVIAVSLLQLLQGCIAERSPLAGMHHRALVFRSQGANVVDRNPQSPVSDASGEHRRWNRSGTIGALPAHRSA